MSSHKGNLCKMPNSPFPSISCLGGADKKKGNKRWWPLDNNADPFSANILLKLSCHLLHTHTRSCTHTHTRFCFLLEGHFSWLSVPARQWLSTRHTPSYSHSEPDRNIHTTSLGHRSEEHMEIIRERKKEKFYAQVWLGLRHIQRLVTNKMHVPFAEWSISG